MGESITIMPKVVRPGPSLIFIPKSIKRMPSSIPSKSPTIKLAGAVIVNSKIFLSIAFMFYHFAAQTTPNFSVLK